MYFDEFSQANQRNQINNLSKDEWLRRSSSIMLTPEQKETFLKYYPQLMQLRIAIYRMLGIEMGQALFGDIVPPVTIYPAIKPDQYSLRHPGSFDEREIIDHIQMFTKEGERVLDPMVGSGNTLSACYKTGRQGAGIELMPEWIQTAKERIQDVTGGPYEYGKYGLFLQQGDCRDFLGRIRPSFMDFIIFSPPYHSILKNPSGERAQRRRDQGLPTTYGTSDRDLGRIDDYRQFLQEMGSIYTLCHRALKPGKFMVVIVSDISVKGRFVPYGFDTGQVVCNSGFSWRGIQVVLDHWKKPKDYGIPYRFFFNFHHHYALVFQK